MDEGRTVLRGVCYLQELRYLLILRISEYDRDVKVAKAQLFRHRLFFSRSMLTWRSKVNNGRYAFILELGQMLNPGLSTRAELLVNAQEVPDLRKILMRGG
jgi:hypothetical protein